MTLPARIAILGGAGSGKSTLARRLGDLTAAPVTHLDRILFGPGWTLHSTAAIRAEVADLAERPAWIIEGTYPDLWDLTLPRADLILWIDQPWPLRLWRAWRKTRTHRAAPRPDRPDDCEEAFGLAYVRSVLSFGGWNRKVAAALHTAAPARTVLILRGDKAVARFLAG